MSVDLPTPAIERVRAFNDVHCGYCPNWITSETEVEGRVFVSQGKPICATCRILKGRSGKLIRRDLHKVQGDINNAKKSITEKENNRIIELAAESQENTK